MERISDSGVGHSKKGVDNCSGSNQPVRTFFHIKSRCLIRLKCRCLNFEIFAAIQDEIF